MRFERTEPIAQAPSKTSMGSVAYFAILLDHDSVLRRRLVLGFWEIGKVSEA